MLSPQSPERRGGRRLVPAATPQTGVMVKPQPESNIKHDPPPPNAVEWCVLALLIVGSMLFWLPHYAAFVMPNPDYFGFWEMARSIYEWRTPEDLKRSPVYPAMFGLLAQLLPVDRPYLHAMLILNLLCSAASLIVLYLMTRPLVGPAALVVVAAVVMSPLHALLATQPLLDPFILLTALLTLWLATRADRVSRWAWVCAALGALTRQENAVLIPIVWALALQREPRAWLKITGLAIAAGLPLIFWTGVSLLAPSDSESAAYVDEISGMGFSLAWNKVPLLISAFPGSRPIELLTLWPLAALGLAVSLRRWPRMSLALLGYTAFYLVVHLVFDVTRDRYVYPLAYIPLLYAVEGGRTLVMLGDGWRRSLASQENNRGIAGGLFITAAGGAALLATAWMVNGWMDFGGFEVLSFQNRGGYLGLFLLGLAGAAVGAACATPGPWAWRGVVVLVVVSLLTVPGLRAADKRAHEQVYANQANVQHRLAADWLAEHLGPGDLAAIPWPQLLSYDDHLIDLDRIHGIGSGQADTIESLGAMLTERGIGYVLVPTMQRLPTDPDVVNYEKNVWRYHYFGAAALEPLRDGQEAPGYRLIATLPPPAEMAEPVGPLYVFAFEGDDAEASPESPDAGGDAE